MDSPYIAATSGNDGGKKPAPSPNYTPTKDPNVMMGKYGVPITMDQFNHANANGYAWKDFPSYADYVGGWAKPITDPIPIHPYYRAYGGQPNINGGDIAILAAKNDPKINQIITRNMAPAGQVPMYGSEDADIIRKLITQERLRSGYVAPTQPQQEATAASAIAQNTVKK
jgi:hypothetical protein